MIVFGVGMESHISKEEKTEISLLETACIYVLSSFGPFATNIVRTRIGLGMGCWVQKHLTRRVSALRILRGHRAKCTVGAMGPIYTYIDLTTFCRHFILFIFSLLRRFQTHLLFPLF